MWKTLVAGTTMLMMAGSTFAFAQQPAPADRPHHTQLTADDIAAFADARFAALKTALKLTPVQEKNWPSVEQALRDHQQGAKRTPSGSRECRAAAD
jgi:zinc resistance-associated protein